jgi:hypothetical protein
VLLVALGSRLAAMGARARAANVAAALAGVVAADCCTALLGAKIRENAAALREEAPGFLRRFYEAVSRQITYETKRDGARLRRDLEAKLNRAVADVGATLERLFTGAPPPPPPPTPSFFRRAEQLFRRSGHRGALRRRPRATTSAAAAGAAARRHEPRGLRPALAAPAPRGRRRAAGNELRGGLALRRGDGDAAAAARRRAVLGAEPARRRLFPVRHRPRAAVPLRTIVGRARDGDIRDSAGQGAPGLLIQLKKICGFSDAKSPIIIIIILRSSQRETAILTAR